MFNIDRGDGRYPFAAAAAHSPGDIIVRPDGSRALYDGIVGCAIGELISPMPLIPQPTARVSVVSANTFAAGATVYWDQAEQEATSVSEDNTVIGKAPFAKLAGVTEMLIVVTG